MQSEASALIYGGTVDNRIRNRVSGAIHFLGQTEPLEFDLEGNCLSDLAGCLLEFECDPDATPPIAPAPTGLQTGTAGEMTASRRLLLPGPFSDEMNCIYLEWFLPDGRRQVFLKARVRCRLSAPEWQLTEVEELEQKRQRWAHIRSRNIPDDPGWFEMAGVLGIAPPNLSEGEWEDLLREAEDDVDRLIHLFDQTDADFEWAGHLSRSLGWPASNRSASPGPRNRRRGDAFPPQPALARLASEASALVESLGSHFPADTQPDVACRKLISSIAQISAVLETARESLIHLEDGDQTLLATLVKRALAAVHASLEQLSKMQPSLWLGDAESRHLSDRLFTLRENALRTMDGLRSHG